MGEDSSQEDSSQSEVRNLQLEILRLETKLKDLHSTDLVATRRALASLQQHVEALKDESEGIEDKITGLDLEPFNQRVVEEELGVMSIAALSTYVADRMIKASKIFESKEIRGALWTLSATYVAWRVTFGFWKKLSRRIQHNVICKSDLESMYSRVSDRIDIMHQLVTHEPTMEMQGEGKQVI